MTFKRDITRVKKSLDELEKQIAGRGVFTGLARLARSVIYKRVKTGGGAENGKKTRLARLRPSTIEIREGKGIMRTFNKKDPVFIRGIDGRPESTGKWFNAGRSNLTFSGQLLESISFKAGNFGFGLFIPNTQRTPYKNHYTLNRSAPPTNKQVAIWVQKGRNSPTKMKPRPFFELTKGEQRIIINEYKKIIRKIIRRNRL